MSIQLFKRTQYDDLDKAIKNTVNCTSLHLLFVPYNLLDRAKDLLKLVNLTELDIYGDWRRTEEEFSLPPEIGKLKRLKKLTVLNVQLALFPEWIFELVNLKYLMVRGNDITTIPEEISSLVNLKHLRVENCMLASLPASLSQMTRLKYLGLSDTRLTEIKAHMFPSNLKEINFCGTGCYNIGDVQQLDRMLTKTKILPNKWPAVANKE